MTTASKQDLLSGRLAPQNHLDPAWVTEQMAGEALPESKRDGVDESQSIGAAGVPFKQDLLIVRYPAQNFLKRESLPVNLLLQILVARISTELGTPSPAATS